MATEIGKAFIPVAFDREGLESDAKKNLVPGVKRIAEDAARVFVAAKIFQVGKQGFDELAQAQKVMSQTTATVKATGGAANVSADQVAQLSGRLSDMSAVDDEVIQQGANMLLTFKNVRNEVGAGNDVFDKATTAALDLSAAGFGSMESASIMLGKALQDPLKGITALGRAGVTFSEDQKTAIAAMVESGDLLGAQKIILGEVEAQVGGVAAAYGDTLPGKVDRAKNALDEAKASLVGGMAPALEIGANAATFLAEEITKLPEPLQAVVGVTALVGGGIISLARPISDIINLYRGFGAASKAAAAASTATATATNSAASVSGLYAGKTSKLTSTLGKAGLVGGLAVAGFAMYEFAEAQNKTKLSSEDLTKIIGLEKDKMVGLMDELVAKSKGPFAHMFDDAIKDLVAKGPEGIGVLQQYRDHVAATGGDTTKLDEALRGATESQHNLNTNAEIGSEVLGDVADASDNGAKRLEEQASAADHLASSISGLVDGTLSSLEAELRLSDAQIASRKAIDELTEAQKDGSLSKDDLTSKSNAAFEAILGEAQANSALAEAQAKANGQTFDGKDAQAALIAELQAVANTLDPGNPLRVQLEGYITTLGTVPTDRTTVLALETVDAVRKLQEYQRELAGLPTDLSINVDFSGQQQTGERALGGPVAPGEVFRAAEQGNWEILFKDGLYQAPPSGGFVMRHDQSERFLQSLATGGGRGGDTYQLGGGDVIIHHAEDAVAGMRRVELLAGVL